MKTKDRERILARLREQRDSVVEALAFEAPPGEFGEPGDRTDRAEIEIEREAGLQGREDDENLLQKIDFALQRIADGTYETCAACGRTIPLERLLAKPSVSLCHTCQSRKEQTSHS